VEAIRGAAAVVVAVDGSANGWDALEWAAAEAAEAQQPLLVLHVIKWPAAADLWMPFPELPSKGARADAEWLFEAAVQRALEIAPELHVVTRLEADCRPGRAVLRAAEHASLIVLGRRRDRRRLPRRFGTSVASFVSRRAPCPVVIAGLDNRPVGPSVGRVAVLVDDNPTSIDALSLALRAAGRRGIGVTVLRPVAPAESGVLDRRVPLQTCRDTFAVADVAEAPLVGALGPALTASSAGAALLVLGTRQSRTRRRARLPAAIKRIANSSRTPVVIVPAVRAA